MQGLFIAMRLKKCCHLNVFPLTLQPGLFRFDSIFSALGAFFYLEQDWHLKNKVRYIESGCLHIYSNILSLTFSDIDSEDLFPLFQEPRVNLSLEDSRD